MPCDGYRGVICLTGSGEMGENREDDTNGDYRAFFDSSFSPRKTTPEGCQSRRVQVQQKLQFAAFFSDTSLELMLVCHLTSRKPLRQTHGTNSKTTAAYHSAVAMKSISWIRPARVCLIRRQRCERRAVGRVRTE